MNKTHHDALRGWLMLLRLPNLPTVPGDPLAGYALAAAAAGSPWHAPAAAAAVGAALCLYTCGLLLNDVADVAEDRRTRPDRPLPAGRVSRSAAALAAASLAAVGMVLASLASPDTATTAAVLLLAILFYTFVARRWTAVGITVMGLCRGLSVLLGATAATPGALSTRIAPAAALVVTAYTVALAAVAIGETRRHRIGPARFGPVLAGTIGIGAALALAGTLPLPALLWTGLLVVRGRLNARRLRGTPEPTVVGQTIGCFVRDITLLQAALCAVTPGGALISIAIALMWPLSYWPSRRFYGS